MADKFSPEKRSRIMASVKWRNTSPEQLVRKSLRRLQCRFRGNDAAIPGKPDIVLVGQRKLIFVHGCFWHGHRGCSRASRPQTNKEFWRKKIEGNIKRDARLLRELRKIGWRVLIIWQCQIKKTKRIDERLSRFIRGEHGSKR